MYRCCAILAKQTKHILESIKDSFDTELTHGYGNEEDVLALGVQYGFTDGEFGKYKEAKGWADLYKSAANQNVRELHQRLANLPQIKAFSKTIRFCQIILLQQDE